MLDHVALMLAKLKMCEARDSVVDLNNMRIAFFVLLLLSEYHTVAKSRSGSPIYFRRIRGKVDRRRIFIF